MLKRESWGVTGLLYGSFTLAKIPRSEFEMPSKWHAQVLESASAAPSHTQADLGGAASLMAGAGWLAVSPCIRSHQIRWHYIRGNQITQFLIQHTLPPPALSASLPRKQPLKEAIRKAPVSSSLTPSHTWTHSSLSRCSVHACHWGIAHPQVSFKAFESWPQYLIHWEGQNFTHWKGLKENLTYLCMNGLKQVSFAVLLGIVPVEVLARNVALWLLHLPETMPQKTARGHCVFSLILLMSCGDLWLGFWPCWSLKWRHQHSISEQSRQCSGEFRDDAKYCRHDFGSFVHHFYEREGV